MKEEIEKVKEVLVKSIKDSELDCNCWCDEAINELATEQIAAMQKAGIKFWVV